MIFQVLSLVIGYIASTAHGGKVMVISNVPSVSHSLWYGHIVDLLLEAGHQVVYLDTMENRRTHENLTHILLEGGYLWRKPLDESINSDGSVLQEMSLIRSPITVINEIVELYESECKDIMRRDSFKSFVDQYKRNKMDLVVIDFICEGMLGLIPYVGNPPVVFATAYADPSRLLRYVGHYDNPAYVPLQLTEFPTIMNFKQRFLNTWYTLYEMYCEELIMTPLQDKLSKEIFGEETPHIVEIRKRISLVLVNTNRVSSDAKSLPPAVVQVAGLHVNKPPKPLPQAIQKFLDGSKNGVILVSFGSNVPSAGMSPERIRAFVETFRELPQKVLWKFELDQIENLPKNVMITKWLPQGDILGHPNIVCFVSHGGLLGTQEAIVHGVPILGIPFMFDQFDVMAKLDRHRVSITLTYQNVTKENFKSSLQQLIHPNGGYSKRMKQFSETFNDDPVPPRKKALFWLEFAMRHAQDFDQGLDYIRPAAVHLSYYKLLFLDIAGSALIIVLIFITIIKKILKAFFKSRGRPKIKKN